MCVVLEQCSQSWLHIRITWESGVYANTQAPPRSSESAALLGDPENGLIYKNSPGASGGFYGMLTSSKT